MGGNPHPRGDFLGSILRGGNFSQEAFPTGVFFAEGIFRGRCFLRGSISGGGVFPAGVIVFIQLWKMTMLALSLTETICLGFTPISDGSRDFITVQQAVCNSKINKLGQRRETFCKYIAMLKKHFTTGQLFWFKNFNFYQINAFSLFFFSIQVLPEMSIFSKVRNLYIYMVFVLLH